MGGGQLKFDEKPMQEDWDKKPVKTENMDKAVVENWRRPRGRQETLFVELGWGKL